MLRTILLVLTLHILLFTSCTECSFKEGKAEYNELYQIPLVNKGERIQKLQSYSIEKQIDIFLFAAECKRDPSIMGIFVELGDSKIPQIVDRIRNSKTDEDRYYLIQALSDINWRCHCIDKNAIEGLLETVKRDSNTVNANNNFLRDSYKKYLENIVNQTEK